MSQIFAISTIINQVDHLFEGWHSDKDDSCKSNGFLKQEYSDADFSVQLCLNSRCVVEVENSFFPDIELHISWGRELVPHSASASEDDGDPFLVLNVLKGWYDYDWMRKNIDSVKVIALALDVTNKIRAAFPIPSLSQFQEDDHRFWLVF